MKEPYGAPRGRIFRGVSCHRNNLKNCRAGRDPMNYRVKPMSRRDSGESQPLALQPGA